MQKEPTSGYKQTDFKNGDRKEKYFLVPVPEGFNFWAFLHLHPSVRHGIATGPDPSLSSARKANFLK